MTEEAAAKPYVAQVGGKHYTVDGVQHWDLMEEHDIAYLEATGTKYITRWRTKGKTRDKRIEDLDKATSYFAKVLAVREPRSRSLSGSAPNILTRRFAKEEPLTAFLEANKVGLIEEHIIRLILSADYGRVCDYQAALAQIAQLRIFATQQVEDTPPMDGPRGR